MNRMQALLFAFFAAASSLPEDSGPPLTACPADGSGCDPPFPPSPPAYVPSQPAQYRLEPEIQGGFYFESLNVTLAVPPVPSVPEAINGSIIITSSIEFKNMGQALQIVLISSPEAQFFCGQNLFQWCMFAKYHRDGSFTDRFKVGAGDNIDIAFAFNLESGNLTISGIADDTRNFFYGGRPEIGMMSSLLSPRQEPAKFSWNPWIWSVKTECLCNTNRIIPRHSYLGTRMAFNYSIPDLTMSTKWTHANSPRVNSPDGGKTWEIEEIILDETRCVNSTTCEDDLGSVAPPGPVSGGSSRGCDTDIPGCLAPW